MAGTVDILVSEGICTITLVGVTDQNPMSHALELAIIRACSDANADDKVKAIVFTGGPGKSFCAGGDFNEVAAMTTDAQVDDWIDRVLDLYIAVLNMEKPTIAAIDGYAIGIGFQLALSCDLRIATSRAQLLMWELKYGIACTIGGYMLQTFLGRAGMLDLVYDCEPLNLEFSVANRLINKVVGPDILAFEAMRLAARLADYPDLPRRRTKRSINDPFIAGLINVGGVSKAAHRAAFAERSAAAHFDRVLGR